MLINSQVMNYLSLHTADCVISLCVTINKEIWITELSFTSLLLWHHGSWRLSLPQQSDYVIQIHPVQAMAEENFVFHNFFINFRKFEGLVPEMYNLTSRLEN